MARRASRIAKSLREESGCEEDTSSDDEWDPAQEQDEEDEEDEQDEKLCIRKRRSYRRGSLCSEKTPPVILSVRLSVCLSIIDDKDHGCRDS